eukprot:jgi/Tetstr1/436559/TSEL_002713.t1
MSTSEALHQLGRLIREKASVERLARALHDLAVDLRLISGELVFIAICSGNANALALLVRELHISGVEVYQEGRTALHEAVLHRCPGVIDWLLSHGCKHGNDLWLREDAGGATPLLQAVREQYVEGVEAMCDSDVADDLSIFGTDTAQGGAVRQAYREATHGLSDAVAGRNVHMRLKRMLRAIERLLRVMGLYDVDTAVRDPRSLSSRRTQTWEFKLGEVRRRAEAQLWWGRFQAQRQAGTREPAGPQEEWAEFVAIKSAVNAAQPGVVEWLLDVWGVDFEAAQLRDPVYSLSDYACGGGEVKARRGDTPEDTSLWRGHLGQWLAGCTDGPMPVSDLVRIIQQALATEPGDSREYQIEESMKQRLRLLDDLEAKGGALRQAKIIATLEVFIDRFNDRAVPRLDLLVFEWLLGQNVIDPRAPFADSGAGDEGEEEEEEEDEAVCPVCIEPLFIPALCCVLQCGHTLCRSLLHPWPHPTPLVISSRHRRDGHRSLQLPLVPPRGAVSPLAQSDVMVKLRGDLPGAAPWLFPSGLPPPCPGLPLGAVLLAMAAASGSALWLVEHARHAGRLPELLLSMDQQGRRPLEVAVEVCLEGPAFDRLLDMGARLPDPAGGEEAPRGAWVGKALASSNETVCGAAEWHVAQAVLDGGLEERLRSGCPLAEVVQQLERNRCMESAMEDYQRTEFYRQSEIAAAAYAASIVVRHGRADVLRWMWLELGWQRWAYFPIPADPSFASRDAVTAAASKWRLGSAEVRLFRDIFDEADRLLEIKRLAEATADDFSRAVLEGGSVEAARAAVEAMAAFASRVPESLRQCAFMRTHGKNTFADPSERWMTARFGEDIYRGANSAKPMCYAAKHGLADLALWLLDRRDDARAALIASFRVAGVAAMNGHLELAKEAWLRHVAARRAISAAPRGKPNVSSCNELWDCQLCRADVRKSAEDTLDEGGAAINGTTFANLMAIRCADSVLESRGAPAAWPALEWMLAQPEQGKVGDEASAAPATLGTPLRLLKLLVEAGGARLDAPPAERYRRRHSMELTIGQSILASGGWLESCWPWLVEERGVDIQSNAVVDEAARVLLYVSPGKQDVLEGLGQAQRRRFALAAILIKGGFPAGGGALAEELRSVDLRTLRDRAGRPVLTAAIAERRPREVLASLAEALKRQGGER